MGEDSPIEADSQRPNFSSEENHTNAMVILNESLLRKRSEHNDGLLYELEEVSLHQEEIEKIEEVGRLCRHLKILMLQNNIIGKIENVNKLKELEYLNLALNNITKIENLERCESLRKLDLTMNFIDFDELDSSMSNLSGLHNLEELYLVGNPFCTKWDPCKYRLFVIGRLPQLKQLDGRLVTPSERIDGGSSLGKLEEEVKRIALEVSEKKRLGIYDTKDSNGFSRESRVAMYRELGEEKALKEKQSHRGVADAKTTKEVTSALNSRGEIRQCNEGGYEFALDDASVPGSIIFELHAPKYMDSSLITVDLYPTYVRCVVRNKLTQIRFDTEIRVEKSKVERSRTTGVIKCTCPIENFVLNHPIT